MIIGDDQDYVEITQHADEVRIGVQISWPLLAALGLFLFGCALAALIANLGL